jgi:hypothetical protein
MKAVEAYPTACLEEAPLLLDESLVAGPPMNVQGVVKDSKNMPRPAAGALLISQR